MSKNISVLYMNGFKNIRRTSYLYDSGSLSTFLLQYVRKIGFGDEMKMQLVFNSFNFMEYITIAILGKHHSITLNCSHNEGYCNIYFHSDKAIPKDIIDEIIKHFSPDTHKYVVVTEAKEEKKQDKVLENKPDSSWKVTQLKEYCKKNNIDLSDSKTKSEILAKINE